MSVKAKGDPVPSPWEWQALDGDGDRIHITVEFDNTTRVISGVTAYRDPGCLYTKILIGLGADGSPDTTDKVIDVPAGDTILTAGQLADLAGKGLTTIENILALQVTATA